MRRFPALLLAAGLAAAPASAVAGPSPDAPGQTGRVEPPESSAPKGRLGAMVMSLTPELRAHFGAPADRGVLVAQVDPGSPGAKAGLAVGDIIVAVRGQKVGAAPDVMAALASVAKGERARVDLVRDRRPIAVDATLADDGVISMLPSWLRQWMKPIEQTARK